MELIHSADARELVLALDLRYDLDTAGELIDTYPSNLPDDITDEEIDRRERENDRRVEAFYDAFIANLAAIGAEQHLTIYVGDVSEATRTPVDDSDPDGETWEGRVWQQAHDRTSTADLWDRESETV